MTPTKSASGTWYFRFRCPRTGARKKIHTFKSKKSADAFGRKFERLLDFVATSEPLDQELSQWVRSLPAQHFSRLVALGLLEGQAAARLIPLGEHLTSYLAYLKAKGDTAYHIEQSEQRVLRMLDASGSIYWRDMTQGRVMDGLDKLRATIKRFSTATANAHLRALKSFANWMVSEGLVETSPVCEMRPLKQTKTKVRRALRPAEARALLAAAHGGPVQMKVPGPDRSLLYLFAMSTGLRAGEIAALRVADFFLAGGQPYVLARAGTTKNNQEAMIPLQASTARLLERSLRGRSPGDPAFRLPQQDKMAHMLRRDLKAAGIDYIDGTGRRVDFHALRGTYATLLRLGGTDLKTAQGLMRHSTLEMTTQVYMDNFSEEQVAAVESLPELATGQVVTEQGLTDPARRDRDQSRGQLRRTCLRYAARSVGKRKGLRYDNDKERK